MTTNAELQGLKNIAEGMLQDAAARIQAYMDPTVRRNREWFNLCDQPVANPDHPRSAAWCALKLGHEGAHSLTAPPSSCTGPTHVPSPPSPLSDTQHSTPS